MGKSTPKAPAAPDPRVTAAAQTTSNRETAIANANLNRINQYTPEGSLEFNQIGTNADGTPKYESRQTYSPQQQQLQSQQLAIQNQLNALAGQNVSRVQQVQGQDFNFNGMTPLQTSANGGSLMYGINYNQPIQQGYGGYGNVQTGFGGGGTVANSFGGNNAIQMGVGGYGKAPTTFADAGKTQNSIAGGGNIATSFGNAGNVQSQLDYSKLSNLPGINDFSADAQRVNDAVYKQATSRLDPQMQQQQRDLASSLAAKGVSENSEAYRRAMDQFSRQSTDAYNQANYTGIQAGAQEQSRLFGLALSGRQQGQSEADSKGQFANSAQQQAYEQAMGRGQFQNQAQLQQFQQNQAQGQFANQAQQQAYEQAAGRGQFAQQGQQNQYGQAIGAGTFANQAQQAAFQQAQARGEFQNAAQQQQYEQAQGRAQFGNQAQQQQYQQAADLASFRNLAQNQGYSQAAQNANFYNQAQNQGYNQSAANAALNNNARQQQIQEASYLRNLPLNEIATLMGTGGGVQQPNFANFAQTNVAGTDIAGITQQGYQNQVNAYNAAQQQRSAGLGSIFGLAGQLAPLAFSDRRLKENIKAIGELADGIKTYVFNYIGSAKTRFGVMADEVLKARPQAVTASNGYLMVDYGKVW